MTKKRRGFDIDLDPDDAPDTDSVLPGTAPLRRGPMASAIHETAGSLRDRAIVEAQIRAENDALAHAHVRLKKLGLMTDLIPLEQIDAVKLTRDRAPGADAELVELVASVREIGLSNPIRIEAQPDGRYELVQGFRRLAAYRALLAETGDANRFGSIPATITARGETLERLYRQMVDENLVRKDISFAEMAQMAIQYAADPGITETEPVRVVAKLYGSASYAKRSHIRSFIGVIAALGETLLHASEISRTLGLALAERLARQPGLAAVIRGELQGLGTRSARDELDVLRRHALGADPDLHLNPEPRDPGHLLSGVAVPAKVRNFGGPPGGPKADMGATISFQVHSLHGPARCTATNGQIELRLARDFSTIEQSRLEAAVQALLDRLG